MEKQFDLDCYTVISGGFFISTRKKTKLDYKGSKMVCSRGQESLSFVAWLFGPSAECLSSGG